MGETPISWQTWNGTGSITGDVDWGKLNLDSGETGYSQVYDFGNDNSRQYTITNNRYGTGQGSATTQVRGDIDVFSPTDEFPVWQTYSTPFIETWRYIQVRITK